MAMTGARPYRGVDAVERLGQRRARLLEAGLDLLGSNIDPADLTVRKICSRASVATRYFYESFSDKDEFVGAVFDWVVSGLASSTQIAVATASPEKQNRAGMTNIVHAIQDDPRIGRLLFSVQLSNAAVARKRQESGTLFAMLSGRHVEAALNRPSDAGIKAFAHFVVGGVGQTLSAWLAEEIDLTPHELVDQLTAIIGSLGYGQLPSLAGRQHQPR